MSFRLRRWIGGLLLTVFFGASAVPLAGALHPSWTDDLACGAAELGPRHPTEQIEAKETPVPAAHCAICHWMRAVAGVRPTGSVSLWAGIGPHAWRSTALGQWVGQSSSRECSPRAPPASCLS